MFSLKFFARVETDPTPGMERVASKAGTFKYQSDNNLPPKEYSKVHIVTAHEVITDAKIDRPPTTKEVQEYREKHRKGRQIKMRYV